jgi:hypothetical protein
VDDLVRQMIVRSVAGQNRDPIAAGRITADADERQVARFGTHITRRARDANHEALAFVLAAECIELITPPILRN